MSPRKKSASVVSAFLVGATGVGKTEIALTVARELRAEILGVDSRQIYKRLEIGTAKPTPKQRRAIPHHLIDLLDPRERCSAGRFLRLFRAADEALALRAMRGLAVGGAGLYVDACLGRIHSLPEGDPGLRTRLLDVERQEGDGTLHRRLREIDPVTADRLAPADLQRIVRAIEVATLTGTPMSRHFEGPTEPACPPSTPVIHLVRKRPDLYARIERRCHAMIEEGLEQEVRLLLESGLGPDAPGMKTLGYVEWIPTVLGEREREETIDLFVRNSRRYAKRQETWFRNRHPDRWTLEIEAGESPEMTGMRVVRRLAEGGQTGP